MIWNDLGLSIYNKETNTTIQKVPGNLGYNQILADEEQTILPFEGTFEEYKKLKQHEIQAAYNTCIDSDIQILGTNYKADCLSRAKIFASAIYVLMNPNNKEKQIIEHAPGLFIDLSPEEITYVAKFLQWFINSRTEKKNNKLIQINEALNISELSSINWEDDSSLVPTTFDEFFYPASKEVLEEHISLDVPRWQTVNSLKQELYDLKLRVANIEAIQKGAPELESGTKVSIISQTESSGYTINNEYGGIITWLPSSLLGLLPSGELSINGIRRSQTAGLAGVIGDSAEVYYGDVITSSGMSLVDFTPLIEKV